jgi:rhomboid protease GluP
MCPHCRAFITTSDRVCPYCNERVGPRAIQLRDTGELIGGLIPQARFFTTLLLLINGGFFLATSILSGGAPSSGVLYYFGAKEVEAIVQGHQYWRLVTAGFLHGDFMHILMNGWAMLSLGAQVELEFGPARLIVFYVVSSISGYLLSTWWSPSLSIGASAALFGWIGAMIALGVSNPSSAGRAIQKTYLIWAGVGLAYGFLSSRIDNAAHIGGIAAGFVLGYVGGTPVHSTYVKERFWQVAAVACAILTLVSFYLVYSHFPHQNG